MTIKIGINGFGIGRMVFRAAVQNFANDIEIVGINDLLEPDYRRTCSSTTRCTAASRVTSPSRATPWSSTARSA